MNQQRTPLPKGSNKTRLLDIQIWIDRPLSEAVGWGCNLFREDVRSADQLATELDDAFAKLRTIVLEQF